MIGFGYCAALFIGFTLGVIGGGGSILTVPILVYFMGIPAVLATAYSLFIVGITSLVGALINYRKNLVHLKIIFIFGLPSLIAVYLTRLFLIPSLPPTLFQIGGVVITKEIAIMTLFALMMLAAAISMLGKKNLTETALSTRLNYNYWLISLDGILVGVLTGLVGAGGGFLIIPALVLIVKLPMKLAVGTSLGIIALKSTIGFIGDIQAGQNIDWLFLIIFTGLTLIGIFIGMYASNFLSNQKLKQGFAWFIIVIAVVILLKELT